MFKLFSNYPIFIIKVETRDALLHAIDEEYVEAVEVLLENEEMTHKEGELHVCIIVFKNEVFLIVYVALWFTSFYFLTKCQKHFRVGKQYLPKQPASLQI